MIMFINTFLILTFHGIILTVFHTVKTFLHILQNFSLLQLHSLRYFLCLMMFSCTRFLITCLMKWLFAAMTFLCAETEELGSFWRYPTAAPVFDHFWRWAWMPTPMTRLPTISGQDSTSFRHANHVLQEPGERHWFWLFPLVSVCACMRVCVYGGRVRVCLVYPFILLCTSSKINKKSVFYRLYFYCMYEQMFSFHTTSTKTFTIFTEENTEQYRNIISHYIRFYYGESKIRHEKRC